jgi:hypothetical protein
MEGECQFRASYDLLSFDFSAFSQISNTEAYIWSQAIRCAQVLSNEIKLGHGFHLRNLDKPTSANGLCGGDSTSPVLINTGLQIGVQPALISIKPFQRLLMSITRAARSVDIGAKTKPLKRLNSMSHGEPPARRAMLIGAQLTARSKVATTMFAIFPLKPGLIFHRA